MRTYNKRIGFLISSEYLKPTGGVGQFAKSFVSMMDANAVKVDIITDQAPHNQAFVNSLNTNVIFPDTPYPYSKHRSIFMFGDSYCYERMANFRESILKALQANLYDVLVCNTYESIQVAITLGLEQCIQIIAYTHLESQIFSDTKNPFLSSVNVMMRKQLEVPDLFIGTQGSYNQDQFTKAWLLPMPLPEPELLKEYHIPRTGILFNGRWEEAKNPDVFIDLIKQTQLPARVITSANSVKKFEAKFQEINCQDYVIKDNIVDQDKVNFITSCRVAFNPSTVESYGLAFLEQQLHMPTVALANQRWTKNFDSHHFFICTKQNMAAVVKALYQTYQDPIAYYQRGALTDYRKLDHFSMWNSCFSAFDCKKSTSKSARILQQSAVVYRDFIQSLNRSQICIDDVKSVLTNKYRYSVTYTTTDTLMKKL